MMFRKLLQVVERRGPARRAILALLEGEARDKTFWGDRAGGRGAGRSPAHAGHAHRRSSRTPSTRRSPSSLDDRIGRLRAHASARLDFVTTGEFRTLLARVPGHPRSDDRRRSRSARPPPRRRRSRGPTSRRRRSRRGGRDAAEAPAARGARQSGDARTPTIAASSRSTISSSTSSPPAAAASPSTATRASAR